MQNKFKIILLTIILIVFVYTTSSHFLNPNKEPNEKKVKTIQLNHNKVKAIQNTRASVNEISNEELENKFYDDITTSRYSDDLIIETSALLKELSSCNSLEYYDESINIDYDYSFSDHQNKYISKALDKCTKLKKDFPTIANTTNNNLLNHTTSYIAKSVNSPYANLFLKISEYESMDNKNKVSYKRELAHFLIDSQNALLILYLPRLIYSYDVNDPLELSTVLGTINEDYLLMTAFKASLLLSCNYNQGMTCSSTSTYMINNCVKNEEACGQDVKSWFDFINTPAHNRDIHQVVNYLKQF